MSKIEMNKGEFGENLVYELASRSYLKYWCYPNPHDIIGDNKEICDLLILFFDTVIIISVKNYDLKGNYSRYTKKVIEKSTKQLFGAERKLFDSTRKVFISHPYKKPEIFNPKNYKNIFRITVSIGEDFEKYSFIDNKEGKGCVNIFNKETFIAIINELDTIKDLVEYLKMREQLLERNRDKISLCKEKDLLAYYLMNNREFNEKLYSDFETQTEKLKNQWERYNSNKSVILKKLANSRSYFIDDLIKNDVLKRDDGELLAAELMTLSRFERRLIADNLFEIVDKYQDYSDFLARRFMKYNGVGFLFIYYPIEKSQEDIDTIVHKALQLYSYFHKTNKIVLLAAAQNMIQWKFGLFIASELTPEVELYLIKTAKDLGWFQNEKITETYIDEYP